MKAKQLFDLLVKYTIDQLDYDDAHPNVGMGMGVARAVDIAVKLVTKEAERWDNSISIGPRVITEVTKYVQHTQGKLPYMDSWEGWKKRDYHVIKGQKAIAFTKDETALFGYWQVTLRKVYTAHRWDDDYAYWKSTSPTKEVAEPEQRVVYYADGSGYLDCGGPCGPLYFDRNGET